MSSPSLSPDAQSGLIAVLDEIIPPRDAGSLPGAGGLGVGSYVQEKLGAATAQIAAGLAALDQLAAERGAPNYPALAGDERAQLLGEVAASHPGFLEGLIFHTYAGYYQNLRVIEALGLEPRPPYPQGYELEPGDLSLLDAVRARKRLYRDV